MENLYKTNILVVDDSQDNLDLIEDMLDDEGYKNITCVLSASQAYKELEKNNVDLIILDVMMPNINGIEACMQIKKDPRYKDISIIIVTATSDMNTLQDGFNAGACDYVRKPIINSLEMLLRVRNALHLKLNIDKCKDVNKMLDERVKEEIDKNKKKDLMLQEQSKLAAMGDMAGAIAHQWRQPLNTLSMSIENLEDDYSDDLINEKFLNTFIEQNIKTIKYMSNTIDDFRYFFKIDKKKSDFSILEILQETVNIQKTMLSHHNINLNISGDDFIINGFKSEFKQVLLNIINNAKDVMSEKNTSDKKIEIKLDVNKITIKDNAGGVPKDIINRIFEPYFTTKDVNRGTGLGLYISKMIIENNMDGKLGVENIQDGAMFCIEI